MCIYDKDYKKSYMKFVTDNDYFNEGVLDINVIKTPNCK